MSKGCDYLTRSSAVLSFHKSARTAGNRPRSRAMVWAFSILGMMGWFNVPSAQAQVGCCDLANFPAERALGRPVPASFEDSPGYTMPALALGVSGLESESNVMCHRGGLLPRFETDASPSGSESAKARDFRAWQDLRLRKGVHVPARRTPLLISLYASQAVLEILDARSTNRALQGGSAQEGNPLLQPLATHPAGLIALKLAMAGGIIYGTDRLHRYHPRLATATLGAINAGYVYLVQRSYRSFPAR
jgi:hypothetical protein